MAEQTVRYFKLYQHNDQGGEQRMVALFTGNNEAEDWLENQAFDQVFESGWHLFEKEVLIPVDQAEAQGLWRLGASAPMQPEPIERMELAGSELIRVYFSCAERLLQASESGEARQLLARVSDWMEACSAMGPGWSIAGDVQIAWQLRRIDQLLLQWQGQQEPAVAFEMASVFEALAQGPWPDDQGDKRDKAAFNATFWWNRGLAVSQERLQSAIAASDWSAALECLELLRTVGAQPRP